MQAGDTFLETQATLNQVNKKADEAKLHMSESILMTLIEEIGPKKFATALHNVSLNKEVHGELFKNLGYFLDDNDEILREWFDGIEKLSNAAKHMEG